MTRSGILGFLVVGGFGSIFGAIAGATVWKVMDEFSTLVTRWPKPFSVGLLFMPLQPSPWSFIL